MNWVWATSLDQIWRSPAFPMWLTLAAAGFFGLVVLVTLLRAEKSVANGALTVITLVAVGVAVAATLRGYGPAERTVPGDTPSAPAPVAALPALSCIDDLAGDLVLAACEKALFGSPEAIAAALSYTAAQVSRLAALGDSKNVTPELKSLRRALEHDRYGLVAEVLMARDNCNSADCTALRTFTDRQQIASNMDAHLYETLVARYSVSWNAPGPAPGSVAALPSSLPTGKPTNADFPSASSTPPVSIMSPEPGTASGAASRPAAAPAAGGPASPKPASSAQASAKKPAPKPRAPAAAPVQLAPQAAQPAAAADEQ